jgi:hypothetical protein
MGRPWTILVSVVALLAAVLVITFVRGARVTSFSTFSAHAVSSDAVLQPTSEQALARILAGTHGPYVAVGSGHSWSDVCTAGTAARRLSLASMPQSIAVRGDRVECSAGVTVEALQQALSREQRSLWNMGDIRAQTIAGALATGTHGSGRLMTESVESFRYMRSDGVVVHVPDRSDPRFPAVFAQGTAGIVVSVVLRTVPTFCVQRSISTGLPLHEFLATEQASFARTDCLDYYLAWAHTGEYTRCARRVVPDTPHRRGRAGAACERVAETVHQLATKLCWPALPSSVYRHTTNGSQAAVYHGTTVSVDHMRTAHESARHWELELAVLPSRVHDLVRSAAALATGAGTRVRHPVLLRILPATDLPFQQSTGGTRIAVSFFAYTWDQATRALFRGIHDYGVRELCARPHWGKLHFLAAASVRTLYSPACLERRVRLLDPAFTNPYAQALFLGGCACWTEPASVLAEPLRLRRLYDASPAAGTLAPGFWLGELTDDPAVDVWDRLHDQGKRWLDAKWCGKWFGTRRGDGSQRVQPLCVDVGGRFGVLPVYGTYDGTSSLRYDVFPIVDTLRRVSRDLVVGYTARSFSRRSTGVYFTLRRC